MKTIRRCSGPALIYAFVSSFLLPAYWITGVQLCFAKAVEDDLLQRRVSLILTAVVALSLILVAALMPVQCVSLLRSVIAQGQGKAAGNGPRPKPGKPEGTLPDLEEIQRESQVERQPPAPIPSTDLPPSSKAKHGHGPQIPRVSGVTWRQC